MFMTSDFMWHLSPIVLMLGMVTLNHLILHHRTERRYALEADRLRSALLAELRALQKVYLTNLDLIESKANYLLSTRSVAAVYRGNLPRLTSLFEPPVIEPLVTWFAENEALERRLAAQATSRGGISYQLTPETGVDEFKRMYASGTERLEMTCAALECAAAADTGARDRRHRPGLLASIDHLLASLIAPLFRNPDAPAGQGAAARRLPPP
jgi:hypothetical protein